MTTVEGLVILKYELSDLKIRRMTRKTSKWMSFLFKEKRENAGGKLSI